MGNYIPMHIIWIKFLFLEKPDIIVSRADKKDPLIGTCHDPVQILNMGKRGNVSVFSTECYKSMLASNVTGWPVTCECPDSGDQKAVLSAQRKKKSESSHLQTNEKFSYLHYGLQQGVPTWCQLKIKTTKKADSWGKKTGTENVQDAFIRDTVFGHSGQLLIAIKACVPYLYAYC